MDSAESLSEGKSNILLSPNASSKVVRNVQESLQEGLRDVLRTVHLNADNLRAKTRLVKTPERKSRKARFRLPTQQPHVWVVSCNDAPYELRDCFRYIVNCQDYPTLGVVIEEIRAALQRLPANMHDALLDWQQEFGDMYELDAEGRWPAGVCQVEYDEFCAIELAADSDEYFLHEDIFDASTEESPNKHGSSPFLQKVTAIKEARQQLIAAMEESQHDCELRDPVYLAFPPDEAWRVHIKYTCRLSDYAILKNKLCKEDSSQIFFVEQLPCGPGVIEEFVFSREYCLERSFG